MQPQRLHEEGPAGGVAVVGGQKVRIVEAKIKTENFHKVFDEGRGIKIYVEGGWADNMIFYETYCEAGGTTQAKEHNDAIIEAIREAMVGEEGVPTAIMGDFNCTPDDIPNVMSVIVPIGGVAWLTKPPATSERQPRKAG